MSVLYIVHVTSISHFNIVSRLLSNCPACSVRKRAQNGDVESWPRARGSAPRFDAVFPLVVDDASQKPLQPKRWPETFERGCEIAVVQFPQP